MAKGDVVEVLVDAGAGTAREYLIRASRAGRRVEVKTSRTSVEVNELSRTGKVVRTARFMAPKVLAVVEHPVGEDAARRTSQEMPASSAATRPRSPSAAASSMAARS
jgi:hypothetical protein